METKTRIEPVDSSHIAGIGYNSAEGILEIRFKNGKLYRYSGVPIAAYRGFFLSKSPGWFLHNIFKRTGYAFEIVGEQDESASGLLAEDAA